ncbi:MAG: hypothetical protein NXI23_15435 [Bacteroidetes bacterium]|jgi:nucleoid DNA-binding protein|nr:hypothetical protein [Bacteroidota bacterium]MDF1867811.1 hypothetical protein [Saprospiraceae bacterium]
MKIDITAAIVDLLYEHQTVVLPGLGAFVTDYKSATIDYVQGELAPPSKELEFNQNLLINDGVLVNHLQKKYDISSEQAETAIQTFVKELMKTIENKEMVVFPKVGKLYRDYENNYKFIPEANNFNTASFGLPDINFFPILREKGTSIRASNQSKPMAHPPSTSRSKSSDSILPVWMRVGLPILAVLTIVILLFSLFMLTKEDSGNNSRDEMAINSERINQKPSEESLLDDPEDIEDLAMDNSIDDTNNNTSDDINTEAPTIAPNQKEAFIIIHSFGNKNNVEKFMKTLLSDGFQPKSMKDGKLTRVGVVKFYEKEEELSELLDDLKKMYKTTPKVWEE